MQLKRKHKHTSSLRHAIRLTKNILLQKTPLKMLMRKKKENAGRNMFGHISVRHKKKGHKKNYRLISWFKENFVGIIRGMEYDPNRNALIAQTFDLNEKKYHYIVATQNIFPGTIIKMGSNITMIKQGYRLPIINIPTGSIVSMVGLKKPLYGRAAGTSCQVLQKNANEAIIKIPSGKIQTISAKSLATIGAIGNSLFSLQSLGNAGYSSNKGRRPRTRGVAMNPVDHPHGGAGGRPSVTPWGKPTKGQATVKKKKTR